MTGLALPTSDIDIAILGFEDVNKSECISILE